MPADTPQHAIRDGELPIIYVAANGGLYKLFYQAGRIELMKAVQPGEQGHMVGYAGLSVPATPTRGFELVILPFGATGTQDRIWHYLPGSGWIERTPPVSGRKWRGITIARNNPAKWLIWGDGNTSTLNAQSLTSRNGQIVGVDDYLPAFWLTTDSGATWSAYNVPSLIPASMDSHTQKDELINNLKATFTTGTDKIAITASATGTDFDQFNRPLTSVVIWRDASAIWSSDSLLRGGHPTGFSAGQDDDILLAAIFNTAGGGSTEYRFGYVPSGGQAWQQVGSDYDNGLPTDYTNDYALDFSVEPGSRRAVAIQAHALGPQTGTLYTSDYRSAIFTPGAPPSTRLQNTIPSAIQWAKAGIYTTGAQDTTQSAPENAGMLYTAPGATSSTELYTNYSRINSLTKAHQKTQTVVAARLDGSPYQATAQYAVFTGNDWQTVPGPTGTPGSKIGEVLAVIER